MRIHQQLATKIGAVAAMAMLVGTSAFADSRPSNETRGRADRRQETRQERSASRGESRRGYNSPRSQSDRGRTESFRRNGANDRGRAESYRANGSNDRGRMESYRGNGSNDRGRTESYRGNGANDRGRSYGNRQPYYAHGRVSRILPYGGGFRVWIGGAPYPFFVPQAYFRSSLFRIGVVLNLGGYYNPGGYYDYYDGGGYDGGGYGGGGYYDGRASSAGVLRGVVESVDYRRDTFVIRNEASGSFVTVEMRDRRRDVRPGDYVELSGDWTRSGVFSAYDVALVDDGYQR